MELKQLFTDDDAVSPVIGVILMVAITVILAAVIGTFVLGLGDQVSNTAPTASFSFDYNEDGSTGPLTASNSESTTGTGILEITHDGGDTITATQLTIQDAEGDKVTSSDSSFWSSTEVSAGDTAKPAVENDDTIRVTWQASGGGKTSTLGKWTGPEV